MQFLIKYIFPFPKFILLLFLCLCIATNLDAQKKKSSKKKTTQQSTSRKKSGSKGTSSKSKKSKSSGSGKKSKHETRKSKSHGKKRGRHGHPYVENDERVSEDVVPSTPTEPVNDNSPLRQAFINPVDAAKPWVFWYWVQGAVSKEGITADLEAMKNAGIGGAYIVNKTLPLSDSLKNAIAKQFTLPLAELEQFAIAGAQWQNIQVRSAGQHNIDILTLISNVNANNKEIEQGVTFTGLKNSFAEYPATLKTSVDRALASGINQLVLNAFVHNPWTDRKPGFVSDHADVTLQRDQPWQKPASAFFQYIQRCQALLQKGKLADIKEQVATDSTGRIDTNIVFTHRTDPEFDIYFIANQQNAQRIVNLSLTVAGKIPEMWDPITGETYQCSQYSGHDGRTDLSLRLDANGSFFIVLRKPVYTASRKGQNWSNFKTVRSVDGVWQVNFDPKSGGPDGSVVFTTLSNWTRNEIPGIKYYSGTADYLQTVKWNSNLVGHKQVWLDLGNVANIASVSINGIPCGVAWTPPYRLNITKALKTGYNKVHVEVSNTWTNRLIGDQQLPDDKRHTWTPVSVISKNIALQPAGLLGPVKILTIDKSRRD